MGLQDIPDELVHVIVWFFTLSLIPPQQADQNLNGRLTKDAELIDFASKFLRSTSTGIEQLVTVRRPLSDEEVAEVGSRRCGRAR